MAPNAGRQPQCGIYLLFLFFSFIVCRFCECQPPETARIARLTASLVVVTFQEVFFVFDSSIFKSSSLNGLK
jgi:hypothetical protein